MNTFALNLYFLFTISWFLHFSSRVPVLGTIRFDFLLICMLCILAVLGRQTGGRRSSRTGSVVTILIVYSVVTLPFVEWPGTTIHSGLPNLLKAIVFFYFTVAFVNTECRLLHIIG